MFLCVLFTFLIASQDAGTFAQVSPNIIFILADDLGWNDVSYHGSDQIPTPNIDSLAYNGVILNRHYAQAVCSPSRASLMTGKYPIHTGVHWPLYSTQIGGLPLDEKIMPEYFKEMGYVTHLIGKWHLGCSRKELTPLMRGFDSHFGYWNGVVSYYDHLYEEFMNNISYCGYDFRRNYTTAWDLAGHYNTDLLTDEAVRVIESHPLDRPLFMFLSHVAVHAGMEGKLLEAPQSEINRFSYISNGNRRTYAAMVSKLDQSVGDVVEALGKRNMLGNSIVVFLSDNGAPSDGIFCNWGSNYPFRGQKATLWEGGMRAPAVIWSPLITRPSRVSTGLMHITDWLPTLLAAAGYSSLPKDLDGLNQWHAISNDEPSPRDTILLDIYDYRQMNGIIMGQFKYLKGVVGYKKWEESLYLNFDTIFSKNSPKYGEEVVRASKTWQALQNLSSSYLTQDVAKLRQESTVYCEMKSFAHLDCENIPCLFNLVEDLCEQNNIASSFPILTKHMENVLNQYKLGLHPELPEERSLQADPDNFNGTWGIWQT